MKIRRTFYTPKMRLQQCGAHVQVMADLDGVLRFHSFDFHRKPRDQAQVVKMIRLAHREVMATPGFGIPMDS